MDAAMNREPEVGLAAVVALRQLVEVLEELQVSRARELGWSWRDIARRLGVSKQAVHYKHGLRLAPAAVVMAGRLRRLLRRATGDDGTGGYWHRFTPDGRQVIGYAFAEARELGHPCVADEHVLIGVLRHGRGRAVALLEAEGLHLAAARADLLKVGPTMRQALDPAGALGLSAWTLRGCVAVWNRRSVRMP